MTAVAEQTTSAAKRVRTCIVCGAKSSKGDMMRIVRSPQSTVAFDRTGRLPGRGAYVCSKECFDKACATHKIDRALKMKVSAEDYKRLSDEASEAFSVQKVLGVRMPSRRGHELA